MRVLIVDDEPLARRRLAALVPEASGPPELIAEIERRAAAGG